MPATYTRAEASPSVTSSVSMAEAALVSLSSRARSSSLVGSSGDGEDILGGVRQTRDLPPRVPLDPHIDLDDDTRHFGSYWAALVQPEIYMAIFYAARITLMVGLPLGLVAYNPVISQYFPAHLTMPTWGIVNSRYHFGDQASMCILAFQAAVWAMAWGVVTNSWGIINHPTAWWCAVFFGPFCISLLGDVHCKRSMLLHSILLITLQYLPTGRSLMYPVYFARDMMLAVMFSLFQSLFPLRTMTKECDDLFVKGWEIVGSIVRHAGVVCWSDDPIECAMALEKLSTEPLQTLLVELPEKLTLAQYEFWDSVVRQRLRSERIDLIRHLLPRIHGLTDTARAVAMDRAGSISHSNAFPRSRRSLLSESSPSPARQTTAHPWGALRTTSSSPHTPVIADPPAGAGVGGFHFIRSAARPSGAFIAPQDHPLLDAGRQWAGRILRPPVNEFQAAFAGVLLGLGEHLNPSDVTRHVPFPRLREAVVTLSAELNRVHFELLIQGREEVDPFVYTNMVFLHLSLIALGEQLLAYGVLMASFDRHRYPSTWRRAWEFFFLEYWNDFWEELPRRLTLATPRDVRMVKDGIKMGCAFVIGAAVTLYMDPENTYYFGMTILTAVGWPTAGDTMVASIYRITGMVLACSISYVAAWHGENLVGTLAISLFAVFVALLFRERPPYSHTAQYCSILVLSSVSATQSKLVMLSRIVSNTFAVMVYYAICVFLFPIDTIRVTLGKETSALMAVADRFSELADIAARPLGSSVPSEQMITQQLLRQTEAHQKPMWQAVREFGQWIPKAEVEPTVYGLAYPKEEQKVLFTSLRRLGASTEIILGSLKTLFRPRFAPPEASVVDILVAVSPVLQRVDRQVRVLIQDLIDAMTKPMMWSEEQTTRHFVQFLALKEDLHRVFVQAHYQSIQALRANFRSGVLQRTFAAAAGNLMVRPHLVRSFRLSGTEVKIFDDEVHRRQLVDQFSQRRLSELDPAAPPKQASFSWSMADVLAEMTPSGKSNRSRLFTPAGPPAQKEGGHVDPENRGVDGARGIDDLLKPMEKQAEDEERMVFLAKRQPFFQRQPEDFTISNDIDMLISVVVAADIIFSESEKLLKVMFTINQYVRSRHLPPRK